MKKTLRYMFAAVMAVVGTIAWAGMAALAPESEAAESAGESSAELLLVTPDEQDALIADGEYVAFRVVQSGFTTCTWFNAGDAQNTTDEVVPEKSNIFQLVKQDGGLCLKQLSSGKYLCPGNSRDGGGYEIALTEDINAAATFEFNQVEPSNANTLDGFKADDHTTYNVVATNVSEYGCLCPNNAGLASYFGGGGNTPWKLFGIYNCTSLVEEETTPETPAGPVLQFSVWGTSVENSMMAEYGLTPVAAGTKAGIDVYDQYVIINNFAGTGKDVQIDYIYDEDSEMNFPIALSILGEEGESVTDEDDDAAVGGSVNTITVDEKEYKLATESVVALTINEEEGNILVQLYYADGSGMDYIYYAWPAEETLTVGSMTITPEDGATVEKLDCVRIVFNDWATAHGTDAGLGVGNATVTDAAGNTVAEAEVTIYDDEVFNGIEAKFDPAITEAGTYTVNVPTYLLASDWMTFLRTSVDVTITVEPASAPVAEYPYVVTDKSQIDAKVIYTLTTSTRGGLSDNLSYVSWGDAGQDATNYHIVPCEGVENGFNLFNISNQKYISTANVNYESGDAIWVDEPDGYLSLYTSDEILAERTNDKDAPQANTFVLVSSQTGKWLMLGGSYQFLLNDGWNALDDGDQWTITAINDLDKIAEEQAKQEKLAELWNIYYNLGCVGGKSFYGDKSAVLAALESEDVELAESLLSSAYGKIALSDYYTYLLESERGYLVADPENDEGFVTYAEDPDEMTDNMRWSLVTFNGHMVLYNVGTGLYASRDAETGALALTEELDGAYSVLATSNPRYLWKIAHGDNLINISTGYNHGVVCNGYTTEDAGNCFRIVQSNYASNYSGIQDAMQALYGVVTDPAAGTTADSFREIILDYGVAVEPATAELLNADGINVWNTPTASLSITPEGSWSSTTYTGTLTAIEGEPTKLLFTSSEEITRGGTVALTLEQYVARFGEGSYNSYETVEFTCTGALYHDLVRPTSTPEAGSSYGSYIEAPEDFEGNTIALHFEEEVEWTEKALTNSYAISLSLDKPYDYLYPTALTASDDNKTLYLTFSTLENLGETHLTVSEGSVQSKAYGTKNDTWYFYITFGTYERPNAAANAEATWSFDPADGSTLGQIKTVVLNIEGYEDVYMDSDNELAVHIINEFGDIVSSGNYVSSGYYDNEKMEYIHTSPTVTLSEPIVTAGTYTVHFPMGCLWSEGVHYEDFTVTYTVDGSMAPQKICNASGTVTNSEEWDAKTYEKQTGYDPETGKPTYEEVNYQAFAIAEGAKIPMEIYSSHIYISGFGGYAGFDLKVEYGAEGVTGMKGYVDGELVPAYGSSLSMYTKEYDSENNENNADFYNLSFNFTESEIVVNEDGSGYFVCPINGNNSNWEAIDASYYCIVWTPDSEDAVNGAKSFTAKAAIYNLNGQRMNNAQKGVLIVNGKKVVVK